MEKKTKRGKRYQVEWERKRRVGVGEHERERERKQWPFPDDICTNPVFESLLRSLNLGACGKLIKTRWNAQRPMCICISVHNFAFQTSMLILKHHSYSNISFILKHTLMHACAHTLHKKSSKHSIASHYWWDWLMLNMWTLKSMKSHQACEHMRCQCWCKPVIVIRDLLHTHKHSHTHTHTKSGSLCFLIN